MLHPSGLGSAHAQEDVGDDMPSRAWLVRVAHARFRLHCPIWAVMVGISLGPQRSRPLEVVVYRKEST